MTTKPRILIWDIETSHNIVATFNLYERRGLFIPHGNILRERHVFCASWKWFGERLVQSTCVDANAVWDDKPVIEQLHHVLSSADAVVHHNGDYFDLRYFNARAVFHGFAPIPPIAQIDTKKIAKSKFLFNSNRLDYLGDFLSVGRKIKTEDGLWLKCLEGDAKALERLVRYNRQDVRLLDRVFKKLRPYVPPKINHQLFDDRDEGCPTCGSHNTHKRGHAYTRARRYQRHQCASCGAWFQSRKPEAKAK